MSYSPKLQYHNPFLWYTHLDLQALQELCVIDCEKSTQEGEGGQKSPGNLCSYYMEAPRQKIQIRILSGSRTWFGEILVCCCLTGLAWLCLGVSTNHVPEAMRHMESCLKGEYQIMPAFPNHDLREAIFCAPVI